MSKEAFHARTDADAVVPASARSRWVEIAAAGVINVQDNGGTIRNPALDLTASVLEARTLSVGEFGTMALFRLKYDDDLTSITDPIITVFGRYDGEDDWYILPTRETSPSQTVTLTTAAGNGADDTGTFLYTTPSFTARAVDICGATEITFEVGTALAGTGTVNTATVEVLVL